MAAQDKLREVRERSALVVQHALSGPNGQALVDEMRREFPGRFHVDPCQHAFNAGQRDVVLWLQEKLGFEVKEET